MRRFAVVLVVASVLALVGCGGSDDGGGRGLVDGVLGASEREVSDLEAPEPDDDEAAEPGDDDAVVDPASAECSALRGIADLDVQAGQVADSGDPEELRRFLLENLGAAVQAYEVAIPAVPEMAEQLTTLRDFTSRLEADLRAAGSLDEVVDAMFDDEEIGPASGAAIELDRYAQEHCGFSTGNN
ncbi:MAG: hypothetical protein KDB04_17695 [Acidimicrobiales bacterium]|nr:hypothetical protein [Acidimicrobiales bacterium]HRW39406.1 hypothetical protein [Aquihabitans sp.]